MSISQVDFDDFVAVRGAALLRLGVALTGSVPEAEDLLQEALARCYVRWRRLSGVDNVEGYVRRVIVNQHISRRRRKSFRVLELDDSHDPSTPDASDGVATTLTLRAALAELPVRQRVVVVLTYYEDLPDGPDRRRAGLHRQHREEPPGQGVAEPAPVP